MRLVISLSSLMVMYDDPETDPFADAFQCSGSGDACMVDSDCPGGETCDANRTVCQFRGDNRDNLQLLHDNGDIDLSEYDMGFLFAARAGGGANGCAWFAVCEEGAGIDHKAPRPA